MMRRVLITGIGSVAPIGIGRDVFWQRLLAPQPNFRRITRFDPSSYACQIGGEVDEASYESMIDPRKTRTATLVSRLALAAAELALQDRRVPRSLHQDHMFGIMIGTAIGGWLEAEQQHGVLAERGSRRVNPFVASGSCNHAPGIEVAQALGARGPQFTFSTGCPSSLQAIAYGASLIASGEIDMCLAGGAESPLSPLCVASLSRTHELSCRSDDPQLASRPFDRDHDGMVLTEGACFLFLEAADTTVLRDTPAYAEILGSASSCDAEGLYGSDVSGSIGAHAIHKALQKSSLTPADVNYVCAHANSSPTFDRKETRVLTQAFGEFAANLPVSSIKGVLGHSFGASGAFQVAAAALAIHNQTIPPTHNLQSPDSGCDLHHVASAPLQIPISSALVTNYGYGGVNSFLVLSKPR